MMDSKVYENVGYVAEDGSFGSGDVILLAPGFLTDKQLLVLEELNDSSRFEYVLAIINGEDLTPYEDED